MSCSFVLSYEPASDKLPMAITDLHQRFTAQSEYSSGMLAFSSVELNATASDGWKVCVTIESWQPGRGLCLSVNTSYVYKRSL